MIEEVEHLIGAIIGRYSCECSEERKYGTGQTAGDEDWDDRRECAADEGQDRIDWAAFSIFGILCFRIGVIDGSSGYDAVSSGKLFVQHGDILADYELVLAILNYEVKNAVNVLGSFFIQL